MMNESGVLPEDFWEIWDLLEGNKKRKSTICFEVCRGEKKGRRARKIQGHCRPLDGSADTVLTPPTSTRLTSEAA